MTLILDGREMTSRKATHDYLQRVLDLPDYYGRNLDALYDLLTERKEETTLLLVNMEEAKPLLGAYADALLSTLYHAALHNPSLKAEEA